MKSDIVLGPGKNPRGILIIVVSNVIIDEVIHGFYELV